VTASHQRRAKIVATVGPASRSVKQIAALAQAGADVIRVNTSHLTPEEAGRLYQDLDKARQRTGIEFATLVDLQGPKLRLANSFEAFKVKAGDAVTFAEASHAADGQVPVAIKNFARQVAAGQRIVLGDATPQLTITAADSLTVTATVDKGGRIRPRMGVTVPGGFQDLPALTERDLAHLQVAVLYADWVALSFVKRPEDVRLLRDALRIRDCQARIIAKIERADALDHLEGIVAEADGVMVARGDLGVELGLAEVPFAQDRIISEAQRQAKTVITATQVLESMITADAPTRAECADIARALVEGTSALMLSAETATGEHPDLVVETMSDLIAHAERNLVWEARQIPEGDHDASSLVHSADRLAADQNVQVVIIPTDSGRTARMAASLARPQLIALCPDPAVRRQLALERGVRPIAWDGEHGAYLPVTVLQHAIDHGAVAADQRVVVVWNHTHDRYDNPVQLVAALQLQPSAETTPAAPASA